MHGSGRSTIRIGKMLTVQAEEVFSVAQQRSCLVVEARPDLGEITSGPICDFTLAPQKLSKHTRLSLRLKGDYCAHESLLLIFIGNRD